MSREGIPEGYVAWKQLRSARRRAVHLAERAADGLAVVLKTFPADADGRASARRELEVLRAVEHPSIVAAVELVEGQGSSALVLERAAGITLREWIGRGLPDFRSVLSVAAQICEALCHMHERRWVHRDVTPDNVMVEPRTLRAVLIDLGLARLLGSSTTSERAPSSGLDHGGSLDFIAPEQTGRMNRSWDFRSDLYGFGATLYFALTGAPPFTSRDPLALIHAHIARVPDDPRTRRGDIPQALSRLVLRLLRKEPEERYLSAGVLLGDLQLLIERDGVVDESDLPGMAVTSDGLVFPPRLYGRDPELRTIHALLEEVSSGGNEALLIGGSPGMGKSSLVDALRVRVVERGGHLASGKFDVYQPRPYSAWISALESLTHQLLMLDDTQLDRLRSRLLEGLGSIAGALLDLVPDLAFILGEVPPVPRIGPRETQERLALALVRALGVLAEPDHPLALLLDDIHASDGGSLLLTERVLTAHPPLSGLLLIATHRTCDVDPSHPLSQWRRELADRGVRLPSLELRALSLEATSELVRDTLGCEPEAARALAVELERKTGSSPFLIREFLENLRAQGLLRLDAGSWRWQATDVEAAEAPEGAIGLTLARIARLGPEVVSVLRFAACTGDHFDLDGLVALRCGSREQVESALFRLCDAGLLLPTREGFRFAHDRIREAGKALLGEGDREALHLKIGRALLESTEPDALPDQASRIAEHLNQALEQIDEELRRPLVRINLLAAQAALRSGSLDRASHSLEIACSLLREEDWRAERALAFEVELLAAEAQLQCGDYERALERLDSLVPRQLDLLEWARVESKQIVIFALTRSPDAAAERTVCSFRKLGMRWRLPVSRYRLGMELWAGRRALERTGFGLEWRQAERIDPSWLAQMVLASSGGAAASRTDTRLASLICYRVARMNSRRGFIASPGYALAACALAEVTSGQDPRRAARLAESAVAWKERHTDPAGAMRQEFILHALVYPWLTRRHTILHRLSDVARRARELGELEFAYYAEINQSIYLALGGESVAETDRRLREVADDVRRRGQHYPEAVACQRIHEILSLRSDVESAAACRVEQLEREVQEIPLSGAVYYRTLCMQVLCVCGRDDLAFEQSEKVFRDLLRVVPFVHVADHFFYRGLSAARLAQGTSGKARRRYTRALRESARRLGCWAGWGPDFSHMRSLLLGELAAQRADLRRATQCYDQAARGAEQVGFLHHAALAYERKASLLLAHRRANEASVAARLSASSYERWGCPAKGSSTTRLAARSGQGS